MALLTSIGGYTQDLVGLDFDVSETYEASEASDATSQDMFDLLDDPLDFPALVPSQPSPRAESSTDNGCPTPPAEID